jgi:signal transduction histidine kinase
VTNELLDVGNRDEALRKVTQAVRAAADADFAAVTVPDGHGELIVAAADGVNAESAVGAVVPPDSTTGRAVNEAKPIVVDDLTAPDGSRGPMKTIGLGPLAVVPLSARGEVLGALAIGNMPGGRLFTEHDVAMATDFATQAALVLMVATSQAAAKELEMSEERARIARDLHDHAIQGIFAVGLGLNGLALRVGGTDGARMIELMEQLDGSIKAIRQSIFALNTPPGGGQRASLRSRLTQVADEAADALGFPPIIHTDGPVDSTVPTEVGQDLLGVVREALSNAARHANATRVDVHVTVGAEVILEVVDNGRGIGNPTRASGLANMASRADRHGGHCEVADAPGGGTVVHWVVPNAAPTGSAR